MRAGALPSEADIVVVGAGIIGASIAHQLTLRGRSVVVLEQASRTGAGATGLSGGMVRAYDPDPVVAELAQLSLDTYQDPAQWQSRRSPLHSVCALTIQDPAMEQLLRESAAQLGPSAQVITDSPYLGVHLDGGIALAEQRGGYVPAVTVTDDWLRQACSRGASLHYRVRVLGIEKDDGRCRVHTGAGEILARSVVVAAGAWAAQPLAGAHRQHPVRSRSIQVSVVLRDPAESAHGTFIDLRTGAYGKPVGDNRSVIGLPHLVWDEEPGRGYAEPDTRHAELTAKTVTPYLPWVAEAERAAILRTVDGYCDTGELCEPTEVAGVWSVRGWNGGGVKVAPEAGRRIAETVIAGI
ncbi:NAD(P)/FAD-dependent oxidoreductase [Streptomyces gobiensis]|uniref:NAD(P)/FAD-dependent oxidoreductase n=1 Tax=Streptomyces gobiensis TaxID=2875706 RepID=UPI001E4574E3|nr:FAD-dependent oxidoreductase [Streptomyces gobiensis]UGY91988.1 FAD-binding oxidoreductase [Streptomyces gobiensis]